MDRKTIQNFRHSVERELRENLLPFWTQRVLDARRGGFVGRMSNDLVIDAEAPKGLILNARLLWTYAALYRHFGGEIYLSLAIRALDYLARFFWDPVHGGAFWLLAPDGSPLDEKKKIYGQAFYIYALSEYAQAAGSNAARERAFELFHRIETHSRDARYGGYFETCNRDWTLAEDARLSDKDMNEKKSMNNHLHVLEAYTHLYRLSFNDRVGERLRELLELFTTRILDRNRFHFHHFFDEEWTPKSDSYTFGHDIEGSWLMCEAANALGNPSISGPVTECALGLARSALQEGLDGDGGLFYEGRAGTIIDDNKEWWPQAEAVVGFLNAYRLSREAAFADAAWACWRFIENHIVDRHYGEWFWRVSRTGEPDPREPKVSEWKCPYHNIRACLEILTRLNDIEKECEEHEPNGI